MIQDTNKNKQLIKDALISKGITNPLLIDSILAVIGKESGYKTIEENMYYTAPRITQVWKNITPGQAQQLEKNPEKLANFVYGGKYGNAANEGYKYRGRSFNQITFKNTYKLIGGQIGRDLVKSPQLLNTPEIGAQATAQYFVNAINNSRNKIKEKYKVDLLNIKTNENANDILRIVTNLNAGLGASAALVEKEYKKALKFFSKTSVTNIIPLLLMAGALLYFVSKK